MCMKSDMYMCEHVAVSQTCPMTPIQTSVNVNSLVRHLVWSIHKHSVQRSHWLDEGILA